MYVSRCGNRDVVQGGDEIQKTQNEQERGTKETQKEKKRKKEKGKKGKEKLKTETLFV